MTTTLFTPPLLAYCSLQLFAESYHICVHLREEAIGLSIAAVSYPNSERVRYAPGPGVTTNISTRRKCLTLSSDRCIKVGVAVGS